MDFKLLSHDNRNNFIEENKTFIYRAAQGICKKRLDWSNDDELSISLIAFNRACDTFKDIRGNFYSYAGIVIRNSLIDYYRKAKNIPLLTFADENEKLDYIDSKNSITEFEKNIDKKNRAEEIILLSKELQEYKLDFNTLIDSSPSHFDTRNSLLNLAFLCSRNQMILNFIKDKKMLPVKEITLFLNVNRKFVEKWRRYLITLILILSNENYPYIKSYLNIKAGDKLG